MGELLSDVEQIWANCRTYNSKSSRVYKLGEQAATQWQSDLEALGLAGDGRPQRSRRRRKVTSVAVAAMYDSESDGGGADSGGGEGVESDEDDERGGGGRRGGGGSGSRRSSKRSRPGESMYD